MARKPPLKHSRTARAIAAHPGLDAQQKKAALAQHSRKGLAAQLQIQRSRKLEAQAAGTNREQRIANARAGARRDQRIHNAREGAHGGGQPSGAGARIGQPQGSQFVTVRSIGRGKVGVMGPDGVRKPIPSSRIDAYKTALPFPNGPQQGAGIATFTGR